MSEPQQQYRLLNPGETIPDGAEFYFPHRERWGRCEKPGAYIQESHLPCRVPLDPAPAWVRVEERLPTAEDADSFGFILFAFTDGRVEGHPWDGKASKSATHWQPSPPAPAVEEQTEDEPEERLTFDEWVAEMKAEMEGGG